MKRATATCDRCGAAVELRYLVRVPVAAAHLDGQQATVLDAPDPDGNATILACRSRSACSQRARRAAA